MLFIKKKDPLNRINLTKLLLIFFFFSSNKKENNNLKAFNVHEISSTM